MTELTAMIAQHSEGFLVVDPNAIFPGSDVPPGTRIVQEIGAGGPLTLGYGLFRVEHLSDNSYRVVSELTGMVFDVAGASHDLGAEVILWPWHGGPNQRFWLKQPAVNNQAWGYYLEAQHSNKVLDVFNVSFERGARLVQWDYNGRANQLFRIFGCPIRPMHTDFVLDVAGASRDNGAPIVLFPLHGKSNQLFHLQYVAPTGQPGDVGAAYRIVSAHTGKVWNVADASLQNGAPIIQWDWHGGPSQLFRISPVAGFGGYSIMALHSKKVIDVARASPDAGTELTQWDWHGGPNQRFHL